MDTLIQIHVDLALILRGLAAICWGILWAVFLQYNRFGEFLAKERAWLTVVIGVGVDLVISYGETWFMTAAVIALSSVGVIARSLMREAYQPDTNAYKTKWGMEDAIDSLGDIIGLLEEVLKDTTKTNNVSKALGIAHRAQRVLTIVRYGEPEHKKAPNGGNH